MDMKKNKTLTDSAKEGMPKIPPKISSTRILSFTFVPIVKRLPTENTVTLGEKRRQPRRTANEHLGALREAATDQTMSENGVFKAEFVYIGSDIDEKEPGDRGSGLAREEVVPRLETHSQLKLPADHMIQGPPTPPVTVPSENTVHILVNQSIAFKPTGLETVNKKVQSIDHHEHENLPDDKVWSKVFLNQVTNKRIIPLTDHKTQLLATPASSKESVLSEDWSGPRIISSEGSQASLSRTVSPCSSVKSGVFSPSVIRVKRHTLVPGSSLAWNSHPCLSPASNSPTPSPCPLSPSLEKARHRPPPTQLTLLTAILRKGRLPILSPVQQRAYSPCWPISEVSLSSCTACNAASKLAPVCPSVAWGQSHSALELHQRTSWHTHMLGPMSQSLSCLTPPPSPDLTAESTAFEPHDQSLNSTDSALERVTSPALKDHPASLRSPSNVKIASSPALQNASNSLNTEETLPCASNPVLSSSFSRLRSLSPKGSSPCPCATGESSSLSPVPKLASSPVPRSDKKYTLPVPSMVSKLTFSPELRCDDTHTSPAPSPVPELTCSPVHRCDKKYTSPSQSVVSKFSCSPELRCDEAHASPIPSPKPRSTGSPEMMCDKAHTSPIPSPVPELTCSPVPRCEKKYTSSVSSSMTKTTCSSKSRCSEARSLPSLHNCVKVSPPPCLRPPTSQFSPAPRALSLSPSPYASPQSLCALSPLFDSRSSTLERLTLTPSPAPSSRDLLTPSPSLSTSSTPSPIPTSITDKAGRRRKPYKIKSSYKALAAIPTNTLLLEQQAIDEEVEKEGHPQNAAEGQGVTETHSEMCSPAQLRQQSEELYAAIDQVLQDPLPMRRSHSAPQSLVTLTEPEAPKRFTSLPRSAGRETKYATFNLQPSASTEKNLTKPGVIRPVIIIPKLPEEEDEEEDYPNPFRQQYLEEMSEEQRHKFVHLDSPKPEHPIVTIHENEALSSNQLGSNPAGQSPKLAEDHRDPGSPQLGKGHAQELILLITEDEQTGTSHETNRSSKIGAATFNAEQEKAGVHETHI